MPALDAAPRARRRTSCSATCCGRRGRSRARSSEFEEARRLAARVGGGRLPARPLLPREELAQARSRVLPAGAREEPAAARVPGGRAAARAPAAATRCRAWTGPGAAAFRDAEESVARGSLRARARALPQGARAPSRAIRRSGSPSRCSPPRSGAGRRRSRPAGEVLAGDPEDVVAAAACSTLAEALRAEGKPREAAAVRARVPGEAPFQDGAGASGYYELATSLAESGEDLDSALDYAGRALAAAPDELKPYPLAALGWVHYKRQEFDRAIECLRRSSERAAAPTTFHHLGMAYLAAGRPEDAKAAFTQGQDGGARRRARGPDDAAGALATCAWSRRSGREERSRRRRPEDRRTVVSRRTYAGPRFLDRAHGHLGSHRRSCCIFPPKMRWSRYFLQTVREVPGDAEAVSHVLLTRAGMIRRIAAGIYSLTPLGLRSHRKTEAIVREEMDRAGRARGGAPDPPAARALGGERPLGALRRGGDPLSPEGPQGRGVLPRADGRGGRDDDGRVRRDLLPPASGDALPDPDEVPRRDPAPLRPDARARVPDVRRLLLRRGRRGARPLLPGAGRRVPADLRALRPRLHGRPGGLGRDRRQRPREEFMVLADTGEDAVVRCAACGYGANLEKAETGRAAGALGRTRRGAALEDVETPGQGRHRRRRRRSSASRPRG